MRIKTGLYIVQSIFSSGSCKTMMSNSQELSFYTGEIRDSKAGGKICIVLIFCSSLYTDQEGLRDLYQTNCYQYPSLQRNTKNGFLGFDLSRSFGVQIFGSAHCDSEKVKGCRSCREAWRLLVILLQIYPQLKRSIQHPAVTQHPIWFMISGAIIYF